jgi:hypothetical protein
MQPKRTILCVCLVVTLGLWLSPALAQPSLLPTNQPHAPVVEAVDSVGMTGGGMDRSVAFYAQGRKI